MQNLHGAAGPGPWCFLLQLGLPRLGTRVWEGGGCPQRQGLRPLHPPCAQNLAQRKWRETGWGERETEAAQHPRLLWNFIPPIRVTAYLLSATVSPALPWAFACIFPFSPPHVTVLVLTWWVRNELAGSSDLPKVTQLRSQESYSDLSACMAGVS